MATQSTALNVQIQAINEELQIQEQKKQELLIQIAADSSNEALKEAARVCNQSIRTLKEDRAFLTDALSAAAKADNTEAAAARKQEALDHLANADKLHAKRITAGKAVDAALLNLEKAVQAWIAVSTEMSDEAFSFYKIALRDQPRWEEHVMHLKSELVNAGNNTIACQVAQACTGLNAQHHLAMNFVRDSPTARESVEKDAIKWGDRIIAKLHNTATASGLIEEKALA